MIKQILPIVVAACVAPCFAAEGWITDMDAAKKQAAEQKKDLMIEFTGSDWCIIIITIIIIFPLSLIVLTAMAVGTQVPE